MLPPQQPPLFGDTPQSLLDSAKKRNETTTSLWNHVAESITPENATFETAVLPIIYDENVRINEERRIRFFGSTSPSKELREASHKAGRLLSTFATEKFMREDIYKLLKSVLDKGGLDPQSQYWLQQSVSKFSENGLGFEEAKKTRFQTIQKRLSELTAEARKNLDDNINGLWCSPEELHGVPENTIAVLKRGDDSNAGKLWITFKMPDSHSVLKYATSWEFRKKYYTAQENRCQKNAPLYKELFILRDEAARMLGYPNHASLKLSKQLAKTPEYVNGLLKDIRQQVTPRYEKSLEKLLEAKQADCTVPDVEKKQLYRWDAMYYRQQVEKDDTLDEARFSEYFSVEKTMANIARIFEHLFGLRFIQLSDEHRKLLAGDMASHVTWHDDVKVFEVWNDGSEGGGFLGYIYFDLFPRELKFDGKGHYALYHGYDMPTEGQFYPTSVLVCNYPKPTPTKPGLLKYRDVVSLFHEYGHAIHNLVSRTKYAQLHGTRVVRDFVEVPSMMLENFFRDPKHIKAISLHYSHLSDEYMASWKESHDGEEIPAQLSDEDIAALIKENDVFDPHRILTTMNHAVFDMTVHQPASHAEIESLDLAELWNRQSKDILKLDGPAKFGPSYGFTHFRAIAAGYDSGYYTYILSRVYSLDIFESAFAADTTNVAEGRRYRRTVLEPGASQPEMQTLEEFLGRKPKMDAFYRRHGLTSASQNVQGLINT